MITIGGVGSAGGASNYFAKDNYYTNSQGLGESEWFGKGAQMLGLLKNGAEKDSVDLANSETAVNATDQTERDADQEREGRGGADGKDRAAQHDATDDHQAVSDENNQMVAAPNGDGHEKVPEEGLGVGVTAEELKSILEGRIDEDTRLGYEDKDGNWKHMAGKDIVFAPSKSVSVMALVGGDTRLTKAFQASVKATLGYVEDHLASVQDKVKDENAKGGVSIKSYRTGNIATALFTHDTSRNQDPLLHVHAVIGNLTKDDRTDKWRALNFRAIYKNTYVLNRILQADFGKRVEALGYATTRDQHGNIEIDAVPQNVRDSFSSRRAEIVEEMGGKDASFGERRVATLATRNNKIELDRSELSQSWLTRSLDAGFDPREHIAEPGKTKSVKNNALAVREAIEHTTELKTTTTHPELVAEAIENRNSDGNLGAILSHIDKAHEDGHLIVHNDLKNDATRNYTTNIQIQAERDIQGRLKDARPVRPLKAASRRLSAAIRAPHQMDGNTVQLNEAQARGVEHILTSRDRVIGIQGLAGVGKTTALGVMANSLKRTGLMKIGFGKPPRIIAMAPTINAASEIGERTKAKDLTVQKYVHANQHLLKGAAPSKKTLETYRGSVILHDESSMMSNAMMRDFLKINAILGVRMSVMIGDTGQHGAVKAGPAFEMMQKNGMKTAVIDKIVRQQTPNLLDVATRFSRGDFHGGFHSLGQNLVESGDYIQQGAIAHVDDIEKGKQSAIIVLDNKMRRTANEAVRAEMQERGMLSTQDFDHETHAPTHLSAVKAADSRSYMKGDRVEFRKDIYGRGMTESSVWSVTGHDHEQNIIKIEKDGQKESWHLKKLERQPFDHWRPETLKLAANDEIRFKTQDKERDIAREDRAKVLKINEKILTVRLEDGREMTLDRDDRLAKQLVHGYATTSYGAQGLSIAHPKGIISPFTNAANQQGMYVLGTRGIQSLKVFTSSKEKLLSRIEGNSGKDLIATEAKQLKRAGSAIKVDRDNKSMLQTIKEIVRDKSATQQHTKMPISRGSGR